MVPAKKKILIVDDETHERDALKIFLEEQGFSVTVADDGEMALRALAAVTPDLLLLDIILPKLDGFTVAKKIRQQERTRHIPIIVFSAKDGMQELFAIEGVYDYMVKPIDRQRLVSLIHERLQQPAPPEPVK